MTGPSEARSDWCFVCGHQREGHDDYNRKGDGSVDHPFVEPPGGTMPDMSNLDLEAQRDLLEHIGVQGPLDGAEHIRIARELERMKQDVEKAAEKDAPRKLVGRDDDLEALLLGVRTTNWAARTAEAVRLAREARDERDALREAARELLSDMAGQVHAEYEIPHERLPDGGLIAPIWIAWEARSDGTDEGLGVAARDALTTINRLEALAGERP